jgi:hypothetical protein
MPTRNKKTVSSVGRRQNPKAPEAQGIYASVLNIPSYKADKTDEMEQMTAAAKLELPAYLLAMMRAEETGAWLSLCSIEFLLTAFEAKHDAAGRPKAATVDYPFWIVIGHDKSGTFRLLAYTPDVSIGRAMFGAAVKQYPDQKIRLYEGSRLIEQTT